MEIAPDTLLPTTAKFRAYFEKLVKLRRHFHANPELSFQEKATQATLIEFLVDEAGIPRENIHPCARTGLVVNIYGPEGSGEAPTGLKCVAFRGDMDALPMTEENKQLEYKSTAPGAAHMCGHDGHMTSLAGFAVLMQKNRHNLPPNTCVRLLFQPAEEGHFGAVDMIKDGCLEGVDEIYGYHNINFPLGVVAVKPGPVMSHGTTFAITIRGPGGHGSAPHQTQDPIVAAGHIIVAIQSIMSRNVSPHKSGVITIAQVHGGEADNVIPSVVKMSGTTRDFEPEVSEIVKQRMKEIVENMSKAFGVEGTIDVTERYPATVNAPDQSEIVRRVAESVTGASMVTSNGLPLCASEDFSFYLHQRPGCFYFLGTTTEACKPGEAVQNRTLHSSTFDFNDSILPLSIRMFLELAQNRFGCTLMDKEEMCQLFSLST